MCGRVLIALAPLILAAFLTVAALASAAPRPLTRIPASDFAVAGGQVLVARIDDANLRVVAIPVTGGAARQVFSFDAPNGLRIQTADLAASAQRAALRIGMAKKGSQDYASVLRAFVGPVGGGWSELQPFADVRPRPNFVERIEVDGERVFTLESSDRFGEDLRVVVRDPDPHEVAFLSDDEARLTTFAGDLVAYRTGFFDGRDVGDEVVVRNWRTGAVVSSADLHEDIGSIALHPDGRAAATLVYNDGLYELRPGAPPRLLSRHGDSPAYAGDSLVYRSGDGLRVLEASGRIRRFGVPTASLYNFVTDGSRVVWEANGCLLVDDVSAPPAAAPAPGPCARSELALPAQPNPHLGRTLAVRLRCVAAPRACRGALRLSTTENTLAHAQAISRRARFSIPAGHARRVRVPLTGRGYRILRRLLARAKADSEFERKAIVILDARTDDGERFPDGATHDGVLSLATGPSVAAPKGSSRAVRRVYADYAKDGRVDVCRYSLRTLKQTLATIQPTFDRDYPDFRAALEAAIRRPADCIRP